MEETNIRKEEIREWIILEIQKILCTTDPCSKEIKMADKAIDYLIEQKDTVTETKYVEDVAQAFEAGRKQGIWEERKRSLENNENWKAVFEYIKDEPLRNWLKEQIISGKII